jgi:hypothetical protein
MSLTSHTGHVSVRSFWTSCLIILQEVTVIELLMIYMCSFCTLKQCCMVLTVFLLCTEVGLLHKGKHTTRWQYYEIVSNCRSNLVTCHWPFVSCTRKVTTVYM